MKVGVVAIQGDFQKHIEALRRTGVEGLEVRELRTPEDLAHVDRTIIPGGESTTVGMLMQRFGLAGALRQAEELIERHRVSTPEERVRQGGFWFDWVNVELLRTEFGG